jgi:hypothetical protein
MTAAVEREAATGGRAIVRPGAVIAIVALALIALVIGINTLIENYRDRVALKGDDGKPSPIALTVRGEALTIPANMIRFRSERRGGAVEEIDLALHWPSLQGFSEGFADAFEDTSPDAPILFATITARATEVDATARLASVYARFFEGPAIQGPAGLVGRALLPDSGYRGEVVYFTPKVRTPFVARCIGEATAEIPATCLRDVNVGTGLSILYRFNKARLGDWQAMDGALLRLIAGFLVKPS